MNDLTALIADYLEDAAGHLDAVEALLLRMEPAIAAGQPIQGEITSLLGTLHTLKGNSGMMGLTTVQQYVHSLESLLKKVGEGSIAADRLLADTLYGAVNSLRKAMAHLAEDPSSSLDFSDELQLVECMASGALQGAQVAAGAIGRQDDFSYISQKSSILKVNFEKLDELLNLVGELVIHRTALVALESRLREAGLERQLLEAFSEASQLVGKSAGELREAIMKVRMLPVKVVFQRFNRLVRDLGQRHGKEVLLSFAGEETEIDKTVIDEIGEPLLHLLRNAMDHGIESPAERRQAGKPEKGTITLSASQEGNHIIISVRDDGRGIQAERIRESAVAKGLIDLQAASLLSDQEAFQLMFLPGFSTSREVTETSGRGIGLDVVKKIVNSFNGVIDIDSTPGSGTCFTIKLPLTLAIIQALMVEVQGEVFAIPLSGVLESIKADSADIHQVGNGEIIQLRQRLLPLVRLARFFGLEESGSRDKEYIVVVGVGEKRGGLVVDRLIGQQEVVIKALDDYLGTLPGVAGGTVLGDGRVALILDMASLLGVSRQGGADDRQ
jgi:two-component system chemotaxis sensor kinase CheA